MNRSAIGIGGAPTTPGDGSGGQTFEAASGLLIPTFSRRQVLSHRLTLGGFEMQVLKHADLSKGLPLCSA